MTVVGLFTSVTSESESVHGIEDLLTPFRRAGRAADGAAHRLALTDGVGDLGIHRLDAWLPASDPHKQ
jgi:hypothetical protein